MLPSHLTVGDQRQLFPDPRRKVAFVDHLSNKYNNERRESAVFGRPRILLEAVTQGRLRQVRLLLDAGVNVNCKDLDTGQTALIRAMFLDSKNLRRRTAKMLLNYGAKIKLLDNLGRSALSWACIFGREDMVKLFFSGAKVDLALENIDAYGNSNLMLACMSGNVNIVETLSTVFRRSRLNVNKVNNRGESALTIANENEFDDCVEVLLNEGHANSFPYDINVMRHVLSAGIITAQKQKKQHGSCNLPRLFCLYTEQLTHSYPKKKCLSGGVKRTGAF